MATEIHVKDGTPVVWADTTDFSDTLNDYTRTHQLDLTGVADTEAREGQRADLGATRAGRYSVRVGIEMDVAPTAGDAIYFYWSASSSSTAGTGNDGDCAGADGDYKNGEEAEWLKQLTLIGVLTLTNDAATAVQYATVGEFSPPTRYGQVVVWNEGGQAFEGDAVEMFVALVPIVDAAQ